VRGKYHHGIPRTPFEPIGELVDPLAVLVAGLPPRLLGPTSPAYRICLVLPLRHGGVSRRRLLQRVSFFSLKNFGAGVPPGGVPPTPYVVVVAGRRQARTPRGSVGADPFMEPSLAGVLRSRTIVLRRWPAPSRMRVHAPIAGVLRCGANVLRPIATGLHYTIGGLKGFVRGP
jgi:hypothetical protein